MDRKAAESLLRDHVECFRLRGDEGWYSYLFGSDVVGLPSGPIVINDLAGQYTDSQAAYIVDGLHSRGMLRHVETLAIQGGSAGDEGLELFSKLDSLREFEADLNCKVSTRGIRALNRLRQLERLRLWSDDITDDSTRSIVEIDRLVELDLSWSQVTNEGVKVLAALPKLEILRLAGTAITDLGLGHLKMGFCLRILDVRDTAVTGEGVAGFLRALPNCSVQWEQKMGRSSL